LSYATRILIPYFLLPSSETNMREQLAGPTSQNIAAELYKLDTKAPPKSAIAQ
jgi:hypothetical protein